METLLIFLAIIALQFVAAYSKQKKDTAKKAAKKPAFESVRERIPQESSPIPDPFREIREAMGLPPTDDPEPEIEVEPEPKYEPVQEYKLEGVAPSNVPFKSITDRKVIANEPEPSPVTPVITHAKRRIAMDISNPAQGILWTAILQEPRYKVKWKRK